MITTFVVFWPLFVSGLAGLIGLRLFGVLSPCIVLDTKISRLTKDVVVLRIEVRNTSRVTVKKTKVLFAIKWIYAADMENADRSKGCLISEWIDFGAAEEILISTETLHASEVVVVERAYAIIGANYVQTGVQFFNEPTRFQRSLHFLWPRSGRWTTTRIHVIAPTKTQRIRQRTVVKELTKAEPAAIASDQDEAAEPGFTTQAIDNSTS